MSVVLASVPQRRRWRPVAWSLAIALAGCHGQAPAPASTTAAQARLDVDGEIQWRGARPCADCDGVDARLVLHRAGDRSTYSLAETYRVSSQAARFVDTGTWRREDGLLRLSGDAGSRHVYALLADGRLEARDAHGAPLPGAAGAPLLLPVSATEAR